MLRIAGLLVAVLAVGLLSATRSKGTVGEGQLPPQRGAHLCMCVHVCVCMCECSERGCAGCADMPMSVLVAGSLGCRSRRGEKRKRKTHLISRNVPLLTCGSLCSVSSLRMLGRTGRSILICFYFYFFLSPGQFSWIGIPGILNTVRCCGLIVAHSMYVENNRGCRDVQRCMCEHHSESVCCGQIYICMTKMIYFFFLLNWCRDNLGRRRKWDLW